MAHKPSEIPHYQCNPDDVMLRHLPPRMGPDRVRETYGPTTPDLKDFFKKFKASKDLQNFLTRVEEVKSVRDIVENEELIALRASKKAQRFFDDELQKLLQAAKRCIVGSGDSGYSGTSQLSSKKHWKEWRKSLQAANTSSALIKFLKKRDVNSRWDLLNNGQELIADAEHEKHFAVKELKDLLEVFGPQSENRYRESQCSQQGGCASQQQWQQGAAQRPPTIGVNRDQHGGPPESGNSRRHTYMYMYVPGGCQQDNDEQLHGQEIRQMSGLVNLRGHGNQVHVSGAFVFPWQTRVNEWHCADSNC